MTQKKQLSVLSKPASGSLFFQKTASDSLFYIYLWKSLWLSVLPKSLWISVLSKQSLRNRLQDVNTTNYAQASSPPTEILYCFFHLQWSSSISQTFQLRLTEPNTVCDSAIVWAKLWLFLASWSSCGVKSALTFRRHMHCIVGKTMDFPDLKINTNSYFKACWWLVYVGREPDWSTL